MRAKDLTDEQKIEFAEVFYSLCPFNDLLAGNPCPWGLPWTWQPGYEMEGDTAADMARNFFEVCRVEFEAMAVLLKEIEDNNHCI